MMLRGARLPEGLLFASKAFPSIFLAVLSEEQTTSIAVSCDQTQPSTQSAATAATTARTAVKSDCWQCSPHCHASRAVNIHTFAPVFDGILPNAAMLISPPTAV